MYHHILEQLACLVSYRVIIVLKHRDEVISARLEEICAVKELRPIHNLGDNLLVQLLAVHEHEPEDLSLQRLLLFDITAFETEEHPFEVLIIGSI